MKMVRADFYFNQVLSFFLIVASSKLLNLDVLFNGWELVLLIDWFQTTKVNILVGSHVWVEDPEECWIEGQVTKINGDDAVIKTSNGKEVFNVWTEQSIPLKNLWNLQNCPLSIDSFAVWHPFYVSYANVVRCWSSKYMKLYICMSLWSESVFSSYLWFGRA